MFKKPTPPIEIPASQIRHISYNGLKGRIVHVPAKGKVKKPIVVIAGMHSAHERMYSFATFFSRYGNVYLIDMPGFGGMDSFYAVNKEVSFDSYAEYLYGVLKTQKLTKDVTAFAISVGSLHVTRMFQMFPESQKWFLRSIAFVGFTKWDDFNLSFMQKVFFAPFVLMAGFTPLIRLFELVVLNRFTLKPLMTVFSYLKSKMQTEDPELKKQMVQMESYLWYSNDLRTYGKTLLNLSKLDIRKGTNTLVTVPFYNITTPNDQYFNQKEVQKGFRDIFTTISNYEASLNVHMPSILDGEEAVRKIFDPDIIDDIMKSKKKKSKK